MWVNITQRNRVRSTSVWRRWVKPRVFSRGALGPCGSCRGPSTGLGVPGTRQRFPQPPWLRLRRVATRLCGWDLKVSGVGGVTRLQRRCCRGHSLVVHCDAACAHHNPRRHPARRHPEDGPQAQVQAQGHPRGCNPRSRWTHPRPRSLSRRLFLARLSAVLRLSLLSLSHAHAHANTLSLVSPRRRLQRPRSRPL